MEIIRFCAKLRVHKRFHILLEYDLFYTIQAASSKITQISIEKPSRLTAKSYPVFEISKIEIKSEECAQEISSCLICFTQQMKVIINCGKSDKLKGKQAVHSCTQRMTNQSKQNLHQYLRPSQATQRMRTKMAKHEAVSPKWLHVKECVVRLRPEHQLQDLP